MAYFRNYQRISVSIETSAIYGNVTLFFKTKFIYSLGYAQFFLCCLRSKIVFNGLEKQKGKHAFKKIEIVHMWHIVSSVAQKRNPVVSSVIEAVSRQCFQICAVKIQYR